MRNSWIKVFKQATKEQIDKRDVHSKFADAGYQPIQIHLDESEIYYTDHGGNLGNVSVPWGDYEW